ncbi:Type I restriction-modification system, DNA methylase subunit, partial [Candidatus Methanophagaceae archaeon]
SFRVGGQRKFFVEAKKPAVNIKEDVSPSYQLRRYAWSAKLPLSIVTDFEELSVFNCQIKPNPTDKPSIGRIAYYTFDEYLDKFDEIYDRFSKEAILKGSFDRYAQSTKGKKGTAEVDREFLKEIESWRELLAKNIALRNPDVSIHELNYAVQKIIDRIIFLRICEDRGIEHYGQLQTRAEGDKVYTHLLNHFKLAESKYNSGIFDFDADKITPSLHIDDKVLKMIIPDLYYPKSPYEFSVLGVEILGNVYEQFLGKVIRLTAGHQAKVETKPEVKKAGGVYYTPQYIVEYIVKNTVGKLVEGKTPEEIAAIKILDPACGSGSFLIGAYSYLLRYHLDWYVRNKPKKHKEAVFLAKADEWYLTTAEKKRILLNNIFGVDIDPQAVEVTKLSLLLKVLEHESRESIDKQAKLGLEGVLPNLGGNIKCGNSLIGPEYYDTVQGSLFNEEEMRRVNVFDWDDDKKGFGGIMQRGGFDCVIGNPPYFSISTLGGDYFRYLEKEYTEIHTGYNDIMYYFIYRGIENLNETGIYGVIASNYYLGNSYAMPLRKYLKKYITKILNFKNFRVFKNANVHTNIIIASKNPRSDEIDVYQDMIGNTVDFEKLESNFNHFILNRKELSEDWIIADDTNLKVIDKIENDCIPLGELTIIKKGATSGNRKIFTISSKYAAENGFESGLLKKSINSKDIDRYFLKNSGKYLIYIDSTIDIDKYPNIHQYLLSHKKELSQRNEVNKGLYAWYRLERPREKFVFNAKQKLVVPYRAEKNRFAFDNQQSFNDGGGSYAIILKDNIILNL